MSQRRPPQLRVSPTRRARRSCGCILERPDGRVLVGRLADELGLRQPTVSHHMKALLDEGLRRTRARRPRKSGTPSQPGTPTGSARCSAPRRAAVAGGRGARARRRLISRDRYRGHVQHARPSSDTCARATTSSPRARRPTGTCRRSRRGSLPTASMRSLASRDTAPASARGALRVRAERRALADGRRRSCATSAGDRVHVRTAGSEPAGEVRRLDRRPRSTRSACRSPASTRSH